jgi:hypothetical protein
MSIQSFYNPIPPTSAEVICGTCAFALAAPVTAVTTMMFGSDVLGLGFETSGSQWMRSIVSACVGGICVGAADMAYGKTAAVVTGLAFVATEAFFLKVDYYHAHAAIPPAPPIAGLQLWPEEEMRELPQNQWLLD